MWTPPTKEVLGNRKAEHVIKIEFCGGWGYRNFATDVIGKIEQKYPDKFQYNLYRDRKNTGRLEFRLYLNTKEDNTEDGILLHASKYGHDDYLDAVTNLEAVLEKKGWENEWTNVIR